MDQEDSRSQPLLRNRGNLTLRPRRRTNAVADLHLALQQRPLPPLIVIQDLLRRHPNAASVHGSDGWLPLHRATRREPSVALLKALIDAYPEAILHWTADGVQELGARLPIHLLCQYGASLEAVKFVAGLQPETMRARCLNHGLTPLQYAFKCWEAHFEEPLPQTLAVVEWLESSIPPSMRPPRPTRLRELSVLRDSINSSHGTDERQGRNETMPQQQQFREQPQQDGPQQDHETPVVQRYSQREQHQMPPHPTGTAIQSPQSTPQRERHETRAQPTGTASESLQETPVVEQLSRREQHPTRRNSTGTPSESLGDTPVVESLSRREQHPTRRNSTGTPDESLGDAPVVGQCSQREQHQPQPTGTPHGTPHWTLGVGFRPFWRSSGVADLHAALQQRVLPPLHSIQRLIRIHPNAASVRGSDGWLPLHRASLRNPSVALLEVLVGAYPEAILHWTADGNPELGARLPIHLLCQHGASLEAVQFIANLQPTTILARCLDHDLTPLQYALKCWEAHFEEPSPHTLAVVEWLESRIPRSTRPARPSRLRELSFDLNSMNTSSNSTDERHGGNENMHAQPFEPQHPPQQGRDTSVVVRCSQPEPHRTPPQPTGTTSVMLHEAPAVERVSQREQHQTPPQPMGTAPESHHETPRVERVSQQEQRQTPPQPTRTASESPQETPRVEPFSQQEQHQTPIQITTTAFESPHETLAAERVSQREEHETGTQSTRSESDSHLETPVVGLFSQQEQHRTVPYSAETASELLKETPVVELFSQYEQDQIPPQRTRTTSESPLSFEHVRPLQGGLLNLSRETSISTATMINAQDTMSCTSENVVLEVKPFFSFFSLPKFIGFACLQVTNVVLLWWLLLNTGEVFQEIAFSKLLLVCSTIQVIVVASVISLLNHSSIAA